MSGPLSNGGGQPLPVLKDQLDALIRANQAKLADLERQGLAADPFSFVHARIDFLIDAIAAVAPGGGRWALLTRLGFEQHLAGELSTAEAEGRKAQLVLGGRMSPAEIAALARQAGVFRKM